MPLASLPHSPWAKGVATLSIYLVTGLASLAWTSTDDSASHLYLAAGCGLAMVLGWGRWMALPVGIGSALVSLFWMQWQGSLPETALQTMTVCLASGCGGGLQAWAAARWVQGADPQRPLPLDSTKDIARFLLLAGPLACTINAALSTSVLVWLGLLPASSWLLTLSHWWAGDAVGVLIGAPMMLTLVGQPAKLWQQRQKVLGLPMLGIAILMGWGIGLVQRWEEDNESAEFHQEAEAMASGVRLQLMVYINALESLRIVFDASDEIKRDEFRRASAHWISHTKGVLAMGWDERVQAADLPVFEAAQRAEGVSGYTVFDLPDKTRPVGSDIVALRFIEPMQGNADALGYNILSREVSRQAYQQTVQLKKPVATTGMASPQGPAKPQDVVVYLAVFHSTPQIQVRKGALAPAMAQERGAVFLALRMETVLSAMLKGASRSMRACLIDTTDQPPVFLAGDASCSAGLASSKHAHVVPLPFAQRQWSLQLWPQNSALPMGGPAASTVFVMGGVAFAAALGALLLVVTGHNARMSAAMHEASRQRQAAEAANEAKGKFLSRMSHELRTPLNAMLGFAQVMGLDPKRKLDETQQARLDQIQHAGWHLLDMIDDVLDLSRIDSGELRLHTQALALPAVLNNASHMARDTARLRSITMIVSSDVPESWGVQADEARLRQILTNLLTNAVKYNRPGGLVTLQASLLPSSAEGADPSGDASKTARAVFTVTDNGLGMNAEQLAQLFQPFNRLGRERNTPDGTGIGLVISRHLAQVMGGQLEAQSEENKGSTFTLTLPAARLPLAATPALVAGSADADSATSKSSPDPVSRHVLYVEDNDANTALVRDALASRTWIQLSVSSTIESGLSTLHDRVRNTLPQLILLDVHLPDASGLDFLKLVKANPTTQHIPVVMISADALPDQVDACLKAGASCYLTKPLQISVLLQQVDDLLGKAPHSSPAAT